jgi:hypothetical protein
MKAYRSGFYWPSVLWDAVEMVKRCEACQFHANSSAGAGVTNHPTHLALCYLGAGHSRSIPLSARGLPLPLRRHQQVYQVGGGGAGVHLTA